MATTREQEAFLRSLEEEKEEPARRAARSRSRFVRPVRQVAGGGGLTVTITRAAAQSSPVNAGPVNFTVTFSKPTGNFVSGDVSTAGSTVGGTLGIAVSGGPSVYNVAVTGMTGNGLVRVSIPAGAATDATGAPFPATNSVTVMFDTAGPGVTINKAAGQADPATSGPVNFTVIFDQTVNGFVSSDVSLTGTTAGGTLVVTVTGGGSTYNVAVSGMVTAGDVVASIPAGAATDVAGNASLASTSTDNTIATLAFPDASTTGPLAGTVFTNSSGELRTTADNQTIQNLNHNGYILVMHNNVTIQNCNIIGQPADIFDVGSNGVAVTGTKILRCKIVGGFGLSCINIELMTTTEIGFCDLSKVENGITIAGNGMNIHDNYIHNLTRGNPAVDAEAHFDGIQGFPGPYTSWTINHNTIISRDTSGIITAGSSGSPNVGLTITNNLFQHDFPISYGMQVQFTDQLTITGNRISIDNLGAGPAIQRPLFPIDLISCTNTTVSGNVHHETGALLVPQASVS